MTTAALVTIDVEPDNVWGNTYSRSMRNVGALERFQALCDRHDLRPTYLVTYSVAMNDGARAVLESLLARGRCEIGAHSHMWETPPLFGDDADGQAHVGSHYPADVQRAKLSTLTDAITRAFGAPTSHRAGRYGIDASQADVLARAGYQCDSSVVPGHDLRATGAPDFRTSPSRPYLVEHGASGSFWEIPCTTASGFIARSTRGAPLLRRIADRLGFGPYMLRALPDASLAKLTALSERAATRLGYLNLMTHSSELEAGTSPYWPTEADVARHLSMLDRLFASWRRLGLIGRTLTEFAATLSAADATRRQVV